MKMNKFYLKINGINHDRYIGKYKLSTGDYNYYDFYIGNLNGYEPITEDEFEQAEKVAKYYYSICVKEVKTGNYSISKISESEIKKDFKKHVKKVMKEIESEELVYLGKI